MNEYVVVFEFENCNSMDEIIFKRSIMNVYNRCCELFNSRIDEWNKEYDEIHGEDYVNDEDYNKFIAERMEHICNIVNNESIVIKVKPTKDAWYKFYMAYDPSKTCTFHIKGTKDSDIKDMKVRKKTYWKTAAIILGVAVTGGVITYLANGRKRCAKRECWSSFDNLVIKDEDMTDFILKHMRFIDRFDPYAVTNAVMWTHGIYEGFGGDVKVPEGKWKFFTKSFKEV